MSSVSKPRCARGTNCYHVLKLGSEEPSPVPREGDVCRKCLQQRSNLEETPPEHEELFHAAKVLLSREIEGEDTIIPTLSFAVLADRIPEIAAFKNRFAADGQNVGQLKSLEQRFYNAFAGFWPEHYIDGVLIVKRYGISVDCFSASNGKVIKKIQIDVTDLSIRRDDVIEWYEYALTSYNLDYRPSAIGNIGWKAYKGTPRMGVIRMVVRPEDSDIDQVSRHRIRSPDEQLPFPPPQLVGAFYDMLRGSKKHGFSGFGSLALHGKTHGPRPERKTLVPACVAWFLSDGGRADDPQQQLELTNLLDRQSVLNVQDHEASHEQLWGNVKKRSETIKEVAQALLSGVSKLGKHPRE